MKEVNGYKTKTHHHHIDSKAVYDSIKELYSALREFDIPERIICFIKLTMKDVKCVVRINSDKSENFCAVNKESGMGM